MNTIIEGLQGAVNPFPDTSLNIEVKNEDWLEQFRYELSMRRYLEEWNIEADVVLLAGEMIYCEQGLDDDAVDEDEAQEWDDDPGMEKEDEEELR